MTSADLINLSRKELMATIDEQTEWSLSILSRAKPLEQWLLTILDQVDYTSGSCSPTDMVAAVLPKEIIEQARIALFQWKEGAK